MKELSIEEKAKAYDEAIERAKKVLLDCTQEEQKVVEYITPELKESEDDRIRQLLIRFVKYDMPNNYSDDFSKEDCLAWLEKQGEQKSFAKYKVGDTIYYDSFGEVKSIIVANVVTDSTDNTMYEDKEGNAVFEKDLIEQKPFWSEEDEKIVNDLLWIIEAYRKNSFNETHKYMADKSENWLKSIKGIV